MPASKVRFAATESVTQWIYCRYSLFVISVSSIQNELTEICLCVTSCSSITSSLGPIKNEPCLIYCMPYGIGSYHGARDDPCKSCKTISGSQATSIKLKIMNAKRYV